MAKATHTPGSWRVAENINALWVTSAQGSIVFVTMPRRKATSRQRANARLIAAAPELLAALRILLADMEAEYRDRNGDADHDGMEKARAAIAKADGSDAEKIVAESC